MSDEQQIRATIQTYFDSMYQSSPDKVRDAFHPDAKVTGYLEDGLHEMSVSDFAGFVASQQPSPEQKGETVRLEKVNTRCMNFSSSSSMMPARALSSMKLLHVEGPAD